tara:strand:+ start:182 stop:361 length:180 start_codon:yes stop_codon:yes gene_type:complete
MENLLKDRILFDFSIDFRNDDGMVICRTETSELSIFSKCMEEISKNGFLSLDKFNNWSI